MHLRGAIRFEVSGPELTITLPNGVVLTDGTPLDELQLGHYGLSTEEPQWRRWQSERLVELALWRMDHGEQAAKVRDLATAWRPGLRRRSGGATGVGWRDTQAPRLFLRRDPRQREDERIVEVDIVTRGPFRISPRYDVVGDRAALRMWMLRIDLARLQGDGAARARCRELAVNVAHDVQRSSPTYRQRLRELVGIELQLGASALALHHAEELEARSKGYEQGQALHLQAIAHRQRDNFLLARRCDVAARKLLRRHRSVVPTEVAERDLIALELSLGETMSRQVSRREGRYKFHVNSLRRDRAWTWASRLLQRAVQRAQQLGIPGLLARAWVSLARHRLRQWPRAAEHERLREQLQALRADMDPYVAAIWDAAWARSLLAVAGDAVTAAAARLNLERVRQWLCDEGYAHQERLATHALAIAGRTASEPPGDEGGVTDAARAALAMARPEERARRTGGAHALPAVASRPR